MNAADPVVAASMTVVVAMVVAMIVVTMTVA